MPLDVFLLATTWAVRKNSFICPSLSCGSCHADRNAAQPRITATSSVFRMIHPLFIRPLFHGTAPMHPRRARWSMKMACNHRHQNRYRNRYRNRLWHTCKTDCDCDCDPDTEGDPDHLCLSFNVRSSPSCAGRTL